MKAGHTVHMTEHVPRMWLTCVPAERAFLDCPVSRANMTAMQVTPGLGTQGLALAGHRDTAHGQTGPATIRHGPGCPARGVP